MSAGIFQLVALGHQDTHITGSPEVSFFRSSYKRHSHFSQFLDRKILVGTPRAGGLSSIRLDKSGDLLHHMFLVAKQNNQTVAIDNWTEIIDYVELLIGGSVVDTQDSIFTEQIAIDTMSSRYTQCSGAGLHDGLDVLSKFYPLRFFCCEHWQCAIPMLLLENHEVELRIYWAQDGGNYTYDFCSQYSVLDGEERRKYLEMEKFDLMIFQVQKNPPSLEKIQELTLNHPVKFLASSNAAVGGGGQNPLASSTNRIHFEVNGIALLEPRESSPYYTTIPSYYHTRYSRGNDTYLFLYPFCLDTASYQPTGTLNFSRINTFKIYSEEPLTRNIYAVNYNILRIQNGMAGVIYAN